MEFEVVDRCDRLCLYEWIDIQSILPIKELLK